MKDLEKQEVRNIIGTFCDIIRGKEICNRTCTKCPLNNDDDSDLVVDQAKTIIDNLGLVTGEEYL